MSGRPLLVTSALPYANGPLHFGHVAGAYLPADIFVRYHRLKGSDVLYVCGTDEHGVAITVNAEKEGKTYQEYVDHWHAEIKQLFDRFRISFDTFSQTSRKDPHYGLSQEFFLRLLKTGHVAPKTEKQHYCTNCKRFLPDRYVEGTCYVCEKPAARGDECKACGSWLEAIKIVDPRCSTCGSTPEVRDTMQYELDLSPLSKPESVEPAALREMLGRFREHGKPNVRTAVFDKLLVEGEGLTTRPITRDLPWGVPVPATDLDGGPVEGHEGKVLYVWFDAPIGYVSATIELRPDDWQRYWKTTDGNDPRLVHFIGKDNIPFHCVVFPAMLAWQDEDWVLPENVPANEFYNLEGRKFSTSDNWALDNDHMFERFGADVLRWYLTMSMPETADTQFTFTGLQAAANADLADTLGNYASRVLKFVATRFDGKVPQGSDAEVSSRCSAALDEVGAMIEGYEFRKAAQALTEFGRWANRRFDEQAPWKLRKTDMEACGRVMHEHVQVLAALSVAMAPFVPDAAARLRAMLGLPQATGWAVTAVPAGHAIGEPGILFTKIDDTVIEEERGRLEAGV